jgi:hypothetical protein
VGGDDDDYGDDDEIHAKIGVMWGLAKMAI